ncbi:hypothetical protein BWK69_00505 [Candidatus Parcubacteria bacterium A4]|nr:MAG: hypothetical protein BWK69_00505 [Candidatus Parcubacteria bacterium A4]
MENKNFKIIYEDENLLAVDKPAGIIVFFESSDLPAENLAKTKDLEKEDKSLMDIVLKERPEIKNVGSPARYGAIHRLDKDTSGIILIAKNNNSLIFFQKQFQERKVEKKYIALATGVMKDDEGKIETLIGRSPKNRLKQKTYSLFSPEAKGKRIAITEYKVLENFKDYALMEVVIRTGRKHQIRTHLAHIHHPIAGDKLYGFKNQPCPKELKRQFLHAEYLKITMPDGKTREFKSELPEELRNILKNLKKYD